MRSNTCKLRVFERIEEKSTIAMGRDQAAGLGVMADCLLYHCQNLILLAVKALPVGALSHLLTRSLLQADLKLLEELGLVDLETDGHAFVDVDPAVVEQHI